MPKNKPKLNTPPAREAAVPLWFRRINFVPDKKFTLIGLAVILCAAGLLVYNAFYGIGTPDEAFYPLVPFRFLRGARPFIDEWHSSQLSAFLQYPFVWLFVKAAGSAEGILLYFRFLFIFVQLVFSCVVFLRMKTYGFTNALTAALLFELYVTEYTLSLDYYTLSQFAVLAAALLLFFGKRLTAVRCLLCGAVFACAVLAEPPFVLVYAVWLLAVLVLAVLKKSPHPALAFRPFCQITAGIAIVAAAFFAFLFTKETPAAFFANFFNIFGSGEYSVGTFGVGFVGFFTSVMRDFSWTLIAAAIYLAAVLIDKNRLQRRSAWAIAGLAVTAAMLLMTVHKSIESGNLLPFTNPPFAVAFMGIAAYILTRERKKELFLLWLAGPLYTVMISITSQAMIYAGSTGFAVSSIAAVPMVYGLCAELTQSSGKKVAARSSLARGSGFAKFAGRAAPAAAAVLLASALCIYTGMLLSRDPIARLFEREPLRETVSVEYGAFKGIRISPAQKEVMDSILADVAYIEAQTEGKYMTLSDNFWYLFSSDREPLGFTMWYEDWILLSGKYEYFYEYIGDLPEYFYIIDKAFYWYPAGSEKNVDLALDYVLEHYDCTVEKGAAGYILKVEKENAS